MEFARGIAVECSRYGNWIGTECMTFGTTELVWNIVRMEYLPSMTLDLRSIAELESPDILVS